MYLEVYPDIIFILNFILDFILLFVLKKVNRKRSSINRRLAAAAFGALIAAIIGIFPEINVLVTFLLMNVFTSTIMLFIAFGRLEKKDYIKQMITLYLITYFTGGLINSIYYYTNLRLTLIALGNVAVYSNISIKFVIAVMLFLVPAAMILLRVSRFLKSKVQEIYKVELCIRDRCIQTSGLYDTGNNLYEPISRQPVIIVEGKILRELLLPDAYEQLVYLQSCLHSETSEKKAGDSNGINVGGAITDQSEEDNSKENTSIPLLKVRMIPYRSIGKADGMMLGLVLDKVLIHRENEILCNENVTAAICDNRLSAKDNYHIILHKELLS